MSSGISRQVTPKLTLGLDEAGRGCWAGPVVAAAVAFDHNDLPPADILDNLADSKKLTPKKRQEIFEKIIAEAHKKNPRLAFGLGVVDNHHIDEINIRQATRLAMQRALDELASKINSDFISAVLIDGRDNFQFEGLKKRPIYLIDGDQKIPEIQAASIIAKVFRDKLMQTWAHVYPDHLFQAHKGYGTRIHQQALFSKSRITGIHRRTFKPVARVLNHKPKLLLHVCCGPDACVPIVDLKPHYDVIGFWYDPNIQPKTEYDKRLAAFAKVCKIEDIPFIEGEYDVQRFFEVIRGYEMTPERGHKCFLCYDMRLTRSIIEAKKLGCEVWTTTLNNSPHKDFLKMEKIGTRLEAEYGIKYLSIAFRRNGGFNRSVEYTQKHEIYRQNYCGCVFSDTYPGMSIKKRLEQGKRPEVATRMAHVG